MNLVLKYLLYAALGLLFSRVGYGQDARIVVHGTTSPEIISDQLYLGIQPEIVRPESVTDGATYKVAAGSVLLRVKPDSIALYLEAGDELKVARLENDWRIDGKGAANNILQRQFFQQFASDYNDSLQQSEMLKQGIDAFEIQSFGQRKKQLEYVSANGGRGATASYLAYLRTVVDIHYWQLLLAYPIVNANSSQSILKVNALPAPLLEGFEKIKRSDPGMLTSPVYRRFLKYYVTYFTSEANGFNKFRDFTTSSERKLAYASSHLQGEPLTWWMANHLSEECSRMGPFLVKNFKAKIEENDTQHRYRSVLSRLCDAKTMQAAAGANGGIPPDPALGKSAPVDGGSPVLTDLKGKKVRVEDFKGKVVYVDFWASWCGPCRGQMPFSKQLHAKLSEKQKKQIVFLYISIDANEEAWRKAIVDMQIEGVNVISPGNWSSEVCRYYQINSIPRYMIINKKGDVVDFNARRPGDETLLDTLLQYVGE